MTSDSTLAGADDARIELVPTADRTWGDTFALAMLWLVPVVGLLIVLAWPGTTGS